MKKAITLAAFASATLALSIAPANAVIVAEFNFESGNVNDSDSSASTNWHTTTLTDQAQSQTAADRAIFTQTGDKYLAYDFNAMGDTETPAAPGGATATTWHTFSIAADANFAMDYTGQTATLDTHAIKTDGTFKRESG